ncbi:hypothetical protein [Archangium violaceum]|uniref:Uncharacterized protein n=1 Tax=Archangium violaceum Cb vi76 TaxID=1406225 RepID=A0A084SE17_9BACT|nr:hypothetical protein [Archangium violaceum]KFA86702.1 hypothetical protein Q664_52780 [Archangium violaceum Cb vi76]
MTPAAQKAAADALVSEIRGKYREGALAVGFSPDNVAQFLLLGPAAFFVPQTDAQRRLEAALKSLGERITRWEKVYRSWAERGQRDDGSSYTWDRWTRYAREDLARETKDLLGTVVSESLFFRFTEEVVVKTAADTVEVVATVANPLAWPTWAKVTAGAAGVVVVLFVVRPYVAPLLRSA